MLNEVALSKSELLKEHREVKAKLDKTRAGNPDKDVHLMKLACIEEKLRADQYTIMFNDENNEREPPSQKT